MISSDFQVVHLLQTLSDEIFVVAFDKISADVARCPDRLLLADNIYLLDLTWHT